jgi:hypothetical protein
LSAFTALFVYAVKLLSFILNFVIINYTQSKEKNMYIYYLETNSGQDMISYVYTSIDRFVNNNRANIKSFHAFNRRDFDFYGQVYKTLPKDKADELIAYTEWIQSHADNMIEEKEMLAHD